MHSLKRAHIAAAHACVGRWKHGERVAMSKAVCRLRQQTCHRRLSTATPVLVLGMVVTFVGCCRHTRDYPTRDECIAALSRAGVDVQWGAASEKYNVSVFDHTFDDKQLAAIMPYVKGLGPLSFLTLSDTRISDGSVSLLVRCKVDALHVQGTRISAKGAAELQRGLPGTWITHDSIRRD
jgi:hypothetical protein